ncbi:MAG: tetratricopeptide repeat protein [Mariprofundales bacterium]
MKITLVVLMGWLLVAVTPATAAQSKYSEAQLNQAIQMDADDAHAWFRLGVLQTHDGRILQAMEAFRQVIRIKPNAVEPHHNLAAIYQSLDDFDAAADELKQVIELAPRDVQSQVELAGIYLKQADGIYRGISRRDPDNRAVQQDHLAQLMCRQSLAKAKGNGAMEQTLHRIVSASAVSPVVNKDFPVPEHELQAKAAAVPPVVKNTPKAGVKKKNRIKEKARHKAKIVHHAKAVHSAKRKVVVHKHRANKVSITPDKRRKQAVLAAVEAWRTSWESRNAKRYLSFYSKDFVPPKWGLKLWRAHKRNVFRKAKFVRVRLKRLQIKMLDRSHALVAFSQDYRSDYYHARSRKKVTWVNENSVWKVLRETSIEMR